MIDKTFGQFVAQERNARGWSQEELAEKVELSTCAISAIEQGQVKDPRISTVRALACAFGESFFTKVYHYFDKRRATTQEVSTPSTPATADAV